MRTRRDFLHIALTAPLLPASLRLSSSDGRADSFFAHARPWPCTPCLRRAVCRKRRLCRGDVKTRHAGQTVSRRHYGLLYRDLSQRWKAGAVAIAGVTTHGPLFCLERWGWDHGLRLAYRQDLAVAVSTRR